MALKLYDSTEVEKRVLPLLNDGWAENEVVSLIKIKQEGKEKTVGEEKIISAIANVCKDSAMVNDYCGRVLVPKIKKLVETKHTVGQIREIMSKKHPQLLVDEALCMFLSDLYLV